jgi:Acyl-protein synthetase, LuxE.
MAENLMNMASDGGFYLYNHSDLYKKLEQLKESKQKTILLGVTFALLDFIKEFKIDFPDLIVMETGGMKGRGKEIPRTELHSILCESFGVQKIHSEYGMAELLSQAYSKGDGIFNTPPWMRVVISDVYDPFMRLSIENSSDAYVQGRVNIIDLANINSCSFIETEDKGRQYANYSFTIDGRLKEAELRGCNMLLND